MFNPVRLLLLILIHLFTSIYVEMMVTITPPISSLSYYKLLRNTSSSCDMNNITKGNRPSLHCCVKIAHRPSRALPRYDNQLAIRPSHCTCRGSGIIPPLPADLSPVLKAGSWTIRPSGSLATPARNAALMRSDRSKMAWVLVPMASRETRRSAVERLCSFVCSGRWDGDGDEGEGGGGLDRKNV